MPDFKRCSKYKIISTAGRVVVERRYYRCEKCHATSTPWDAWAGMGKGHLTLGARRLASLVASTWSFDESSKQLFELTGLKISDQTIRRVAIDEGTRAAAWLDSSFAAGDKYRRAAGEHEVSTDGTMVNTREGWKEIRLTTAAKREPGAGVDPLSWQDLQTRDLPKPNACFTTARFADCEEMGQVWRSMVPRLNLNQGRVSSINDGAKWIWSQMGEVFPAAQQVVDIFHLSQHVHTCADALRGKGASETREWSRERLMELVQHGSGTCLWGLNQSQERDTSLNETQRAELKSLIGYVTENQARMPYAQRLREGRPIGSGKIEGSCKNIVGKRLKMNSARWTLAGATGIAQLRCLQYSELWDAHFATREAT